MYYQILGGQKVIFEKEEVDEIKKFDKPGLNISGDKWMDEQTDEWMDR